MTRRHLPDLVPVLRAQEVIAPHALASDAGVAAALCSQRTRAASHADLAAQAQRPGSEEALNLPSRTGEYLRYRDGRVTDLAGNLLEKAR